MKGIKLLIICLVCFVLGCVFTIRGIEIIDTRHIQFLGEVFDYE